MFIVSKPKHYVEVPKMAHNDLIHSKHLAVYQPSVNRTSSV